jgi:hypothetical protein
MANGVNLIVFITHNAIRKTLDVIFMTHDAILTMHKEYEFEKTKPILK